MGYIFIVNIFEYGYKSTCGNVVSVIMQWVICHFRGGRVGRGRTGGGRGKAGGGSPEGRCNVEMEGRREGHYLLLLQAHSEDILSLAEVSFGCKLYLFMCPLRVQGTVMDSVQLSIAPVTLTLQEGTLGMGLVK